MIKAFLTAISLCLAALVSGAGEYRFLDGAWAAQGKGLELQTGPVLTLRLGEAAIGAQSRLLLKQPAELKDADALQFWYDMPLRHGVDFGHSVKAVFADAKGAETLVDAARCVSSHYCPGNSRLAGLWMLADVRVPKNKGLVKFVGLQLDYESYWGKLKPGESSVLHFKGFALDSQDYATAKLYYVLGNFGGNFANEHFNANGSRALTDVSGASPYPFLLLDNAIDQAFDKRPKTVDVALEAYDSDDKPRWRGRQNALPAVTAQDFLHKLEIPISAPGTYRIKAKSYDAASGAYFTTCWSKLVIVRGPAATIPSSTAPATLAINPDKPFGRLGKAEEKRIDFKLGPLPGSGKVELKYAVVPYSFWIPKREAVRPEPLTHSLEVAPDSVAGVPYAPVSRVGLVMAELWRDGVRIDREERMIGVENSLARPGLLSRLFASPAVPTIDEAFPDRIWKNSQFHGLDPSGPDSLATFEKALDGGAGRVSPYVGFNLTLERFSPMPGVYDWDFLEKLFDAAQAKDCKIVLYMAQKYPPYWAPVDFYVAEDGRVHNTGIVWRYLVGGCNYASGLHVPGIIKEFNTQLARRFVGHPGFGAYYFETEHLVSGWTASLPASQDAGNRKVYAEFLQTRYPSIAALNAKYGSAFKSFDEVKVPAARPPKRATRCDFMEYQRWLAEKFTLDCQLDAVRAEDPDRPVFIYTIPGSAAFFKQVAASGAMMANGGVHSNFDTDVFREAHQAVPGLRERMEPHAIWSYQPVPHGLDEMIFGMLAMGGRGLNFHFFLDPRGFSFEKFAADQANGYAAVMERMDVLRELAKTEKAYDGVGILDLRKSCDYCGGAYGSGIRPWMAALYVRKHLEPRVHTLGMELAHLDGAKLIVATGEVVAQDEIEYLRSFLEAGGKLALERGAAEIALETPDTPGHALLDALGIDPAAKGDTIPGLALAHGLYQSGSGEVVLFRKDMRGKDWDQAATALLKWSEADAGRLADSDDPYMQTHLLRSPDADYLAVTHRGYDINAYDGPREWAGSARLLAPAGAGPFEVDELWTTGKPARVGIFTREELARGFDAGHFSELQMKVFRVRPVGQERPR